MAEKHRCVYCRRITGSQLFAQYGSGSSREEYPCCSSECQQKAERYFRFCRWGVPVFLLLTLVALGLLLATALGFSSDERLTLAGMGLFGVLLLLFPFPTGTTVERWGIRRTNLVIRIAGAVIVAATAVMGWQIF